MAKTGYGAPVDHKALEEAWALGGIKRTISRVLQHEQNVLMVVERVEEGGEVGYQARLCLLGEDAELHTLYDPFEGKFQLCGGGSAVWEAINALDARCAQYQM